MNPTLLFEGLAQFCGDPVGGMGEAAALAMQGGHQGGNLRLQSLHQLREIRGDVWAKGGFVDEQALFVGVGTQDQPDVIADLPDKHRGHIG